MCSIWQNFLFPSVKYLGLQNHVRQLLGASRMTGKQTCIMSTQSTKNLSLVVQGYRRADLRNVARLRFLKDTWMCPPGGRRPHMVLGCAWEGVPKTKHGNSWSPDSLNKPTISARHTRVG